jgi:hypothetical protein
VCTDIPALVLIWALTLTVLALAGAAVAGLIQATREPKPKTRPGRDYDPDFVMSVLKE